MMKERSSGMSKLLILITMIINFILCAFPQSKTSVPVPFVGCESHDQLESYAAPIEQDKQVMADKIAAGKLAYYKTKITSGVLAPRGWHCFGVLGSSGSDFLATPQPIDRTKPFHFTRDGNTGPAIQVREICTDNSGRLDIARIIARAFPKQRAFAQNIFQMHDAPLSEYPFGPYLKDTLIRRNDWIVEYQTPPGSEGLGTILQLPIGALPIQGAAILRNESPDCLLFLAVRLNPDMADLAPQIIQQIECENGGKHSLK
jgi:hypothetical protein